MPASPSLFQREELLATSTSTFVFRSVVVAVMHDTVKTKGMTWEREKMEV